MTKPVDAITPQTWRCSLFTRTLTVRTVEIRPPKWLRSPDEPSGKCWADGLAQP